MDNNLSSGVEGSDGVLGRREGDVDGREGRAKGREEGGRVDDLEGRHGRRDVVGSERGEEERT